MWKPWSFSSGSLAEMRETATCAEIVAADSSQLSTVLVPVLRRYSKSTHEYLRGIGSESLRGRCGKRFTCAETVVEDFPRRERPYWGCPSPNFAGRVEGKFFRLSFRFIDLCVFSVRRAVPPGALVPNTDT